MFYTKPVSVRYAYAGDFVIESRSTDRHCCRKCRRRRSCRLTQAWASACAARYRALIDRDLLTHTFHSVKRLELYRCLSLPWLQPLTPLLQKDFRSALPNLQNHTCSPTRYMTITRQRTTQLCLLCRLSMQQLLPTFLCLSSTLLSGRHSLALPSYDLICRQCLLYWIATYVTCTSDSAKVAHYSLNNAQVFSLYG